MAYMIRWYILIKDTASYTSETDGIISNVTKNDIRILKAEATKAFIQYKRLIM